MLIQPKKVFTQQVETLYHQIQKADAIVVGAGSGMSAAAGFRHYYERDKDFIAFCGDFEKKYGYHNSFDGFYYHYRTTEERWAFISRMICMILDAKTGQPYYDIYEILKTKNYHILTTNQDIQFSHVFPAEKISAIQGDWRYLQCSRRCHDKLYPSKDICEKMNAAIDSNLKVPSELIPHCPKCSAEMEPWVRSFVFLEGKKYKEEYEKLNAFLLKNKDKKILFLELGDGRMTPMFIQQPFWNLTYSLPNAFYININPKDALIPEAIKSKGFIISEDIARVLHELKNRMSEVSHDEQ